MASSPRTRRKPSPSLNAVPTRTCSTLPSGRVTATVTGNPGSLMGRAYYPGRASQRLDGVAAPGNGFWTDVALQERPAVIGEAAGAVDFDRSAVRVDPAVLGRRGDLLRAGEHPIQGAQIHARAHLSASGQVHRGGV